MSGARNAGIVAGIAGGVLGLGYAAAKAVARADRRRYGISGDLERLAIAALADPPNTRTSTIRGRDGSRLYIRECGSETAQPIVLLHGVTLQGSIWSSQLRDLSDEFRVVALDWRGHGRSTPGRSGFGLGLLAADLLTVLETLDLRRAVLVGHSMGGMAIMHLCANHSGAVAERVAGLVFQSTAASDVASGPGTAPLKLLRMFAERRPAAAGRLANAPADLGYVGARIGFGKNPSPVWVEQTRLLLDAMEPAPLAKSVLALLDHDERESLRAVSTPSLVLVGANDVVTPPSQAHDIARRIVDAELRTFPGAGHTLMLERSAELAETLRHFARRVGDAERTALEGRALRP